MPAKMILPQDEISSKKSMAVAMFFERMFKRIGRSVSDRPFTYIFLTVIASILCCFGFVHFRIEMLPHKLWLTPDSDFLDTLKWSSENFKNSFRREAALIEGDNVLHPKYMKEIYRTLKTVSTMEVFDNDGNKYRLNDVCLRIPHLSKIKESWIARSLSYFVSDDASHSNDWSLLLDEETYCTLFDSLPQVCLIMSVLEMWDVTEDLIDSLTQQDIINKVNTANRSATFDFPFEFNRTLGGITRNETGHIVAAKSALVIWITMVNKTSSSYKKIISGGLSDEIDDGLYNWEDKFISTILNDSDRPEWVNAYPHAKISFHHISKEFNGDFMLLLIGTIILYIYVIIMLGRVNMVESRPMLSLLGFVSIYLSIAAAFGVCTAMGIMFSPLHTFLPLILLGLGVDDMFVLMRTWENLMNDKLLAKKSLRYRLAETLKKSGVAIFITSLTDCVAFGIGSLTTLPGLRSFCLYSAIGVAFLFVSQITFFFACFVLDQKRLEENRNSFLYCIKYTNWRPNSFSQRNFIHKGFQNFSECLMKPKVKVFIMSLTGVLTSVGLLGIANLSQEFNPMWLLPQSSYVYKFAVRIFEYFPEAGSEGEIFLDKQALTTDLHKVGLITAELERLPSISKIESFYNGLVSYTLEDTDLDITQLNVNETLSSAILGRFLFSSAGGEYLRYFSFDGLLQCGHDVPPVHSVKVRYVHANLPTRNARIQAMDDVKAIVRRANFSGYAQATSRSYSGWETDKIIVKELVQNVSLSLIAVFIMISLLLANIKASFLVFVCVLITLIEVLALMAWWGLTIDVVTCIDLVLCVGLSVDYCAHVALHFMKASGTKSERAKASLVEIGPAVLNGGFSTYLAFALLFNSNSHVFISFYKVFLGVFIFGLYQGLVFLPVFLSIFGPTSYNLEGGRCSTPEIIKEVQKRSLIQIDSQPCE